MPGSIPPGCSRLSAAGPPERVHPMPAPSANMRHAGSEAVQITDPTLNRGDLHMAQLKIALDAKRFATGMTWKDYLAQMGDTKARTEENYHHTALTEDERRFFAGIRQVRYALMLAENWCGDVHRNSPMLARIVEAMPQCELRVFFRDQNLDLTDAYLNNGYRSIPVLVLFDQDWTEIGHWIERPHVATQRSFAIRAKTTDIAPQDKQEAALQEFRSQVQAAYATATPDKSLWRDTVKEVRTVLELRLGLAPKA